MANIVIQSNVRVARDPEVRYSNGEAPLAIARFNIASPKPKKDAKPDFIPCVAFGKTAELVEKYVFKGMKINLQGSWQTGSYEKDGKTIYTHEILVNNIEFCEYKKSGTQPEETKETTGDSFVADDGLDDLDDEGLPWN